MLNIAPLCPPLRDRSESRFGVEVAPRRLVPRNIDWWHLVEAFGIPLDFVPTPKPSLSHDGFTVLTIPTPAQQEDRKARAAVSAVWERNSL